MKFQIEQQVLAVVFAILAQPLLKAMIYRKSSCEFSFLQEQEAGLETNLKLSGALIRVEMM